MKDKVRILLIGIGGYGSNYPTWILNDPEYPVEIAGVVDPAAVSGKLNFDMHNDSNGNLLKLKEMNVPMFATLDEFFAAGHTADLTINSTPIPYHAELSIKALENGCRVFCEKPLCGSIQDAEAMINAARKTGNNLSIGYQVPYQDDILSLKQDIITGKYGMLLRARALNIMTRNCEYYQRANWAGRKQMPNGTWVLDSIAHNNSAHLLNFMLFMAGETLSSAVRPAFVQAELYRAHDIENFDSSVIRVQTVNHQEIWYGTTEVGDEDPVGPVVELEFPGCVMVFTDWLNQGTVKYHDGREHGLLAGPRIENAKFWKEVRAAAGFDDFTYPARSAMMEVLVINGAQDSSEIIDFPRHLITFSDAGSEPNIRVAGVTALWRKCFEKRQLPSETGLVNWTRPGEIVDVRDYHHYPQISKEVDLCVSY